jgi:UDP-3-O-[3-hydroxymyristoyl] glucosamine N-acyltransferase
MYTVEGTWGKKQVKRNEFDEMYAGVLVHRTARIEVEDFTAGEGTVVNAHVVICGTKVHMGRECWIDEYAVVGGGSCDDKVAFLEAGNWLHMGQFSQLNIARGISAGDEVGIGIGSRIFTHGAYLSEWEGFPVTFQGVTMGDRVWLPNALVNPGVNIGSDVVVAAGAVVLSDIASGCLAGGVPAKILKSGAYPNKRGKAEREILLKS